MENNTRLKIAFYKTSSGSEPVREWLKALDKEDRKIIGEDIKDVQEYWPLGMPLVKPLGQGLYEVRSNLNNKRIGRVFFGTSKGIILLLHSIIKKSQKTRKKDLDLARNRLKDTLK